jgi:hypothetical protein
MAAETLAGSRAVTTLPLGGAGSGGDVKAAWGTVTVDASSEDGDIFQVCYVPAGATVIGGFWYSIDGDTGIEALDIDIGWAANGVDAADPDGFGNNGTLVGAEFAPTGYVIPFTGVLQTVGPKTFTADTLIQIETNTAAATGAAMEVTLVVYYLYNANTTVPDAPV